MAGQEGLEDALERAGDEQGQDGVIDVEAVAVASEEAQGAEAEEPCGQRVVVEGDGDEGGAGEGEDGELHRV